MGTLFTLIRRTASRADVSPGRAAALAVLCALSSLAGAQSVLPIQWKYAPIFTPYCVAYSPDRRHIVAGGEGGAQLITISTGDTVYLTTTSETVNEATFSPDGRLLVLSGIDSYAGFQSGLVEFWDTSSGKQVATLPFNSIWAPSVVFSPDGKTLAIGGSHNFTGFLELYGTAKFQLIQSYDTVAQPVESIAFSPDGATIAAGAGGDNRGSVLEFYDTKSGKQKQAFTFDGFSVIPAIAFSPDGKTCADVIDEDAAPELELRNATTGSLVQDLPTGMAVFTGLAYSPNGKLLAVGGQSKGIAGALELWTMPGGKLAASLPTSTSQGLYGLGWSPDGARLASVGSDSTTGIISPLEIWKVSTDRLESTLDLAPSVTSRAIAISPDGKTIANGVGITTTSPYRGAVQLWNAATAKPLATLKTAAAYSVDAVAFSADGKILVVGGSESTSAGPLSGVLELWSTATASRLAQLGTSITSDVKSIGVSPDGKTMAVGGVSAQRGGIVELWDLASRKKTASFVVSPAGYIVAVAWTPDGKELAVAGYQSSGGLVELLDAPSGQIVRSFPTSVSTEQSAAISPDGTTLVTGGYVTFDGPQHPDQFAELEERNLFEGTRVALIQDTWAGSNPTLAFPSHGKVFFAGAAAYSSVDGSMLFSASNIGGVEAMCFTPDGSKIAMTNGSLVVTPNPLYTYGLLSGLKLSSKSVKGGSSVTATVTLDDAAPAGGAVLSVSCDVASITIPKTVTVSAGQRTATFEVQTKAVKSKTLATITGTLADTKVTVGLTEF